METRREKGKRADDKDTGRDNDRDIEKEPKTGIESDRQGKSDGDRDQEEESETGKETDRH